MVNVEYQKYDVVWVNFGNTAKGCEQYGSRPAMIIQNDMGNKHSTTTIVALVTSVIKRFDMPTHVILPTETGMHKTSFVELEQIRTIDKSRIVSKLNVTLTDKQKAQIDTAIRISLHV